jgi:putative transposase
MAADPRRLARPGAPSGRSRGEPQRGDRRQPDREDDAKGGPTGYDPAKKIKGRKRSLIVDTLGLILDLWVHPADLPDREGARELFAALRQQCPRLEKVYADGAYAGELAAWSEREVGVALEIVKRSPTAAGFVVLKKRWIVERTFGWFGRYRRSAQEDKATCESSEDLIYAAMINRMLHCLHPG